MKAYFCDSCRQPVVFENVTCVRCGRVLAFLPETLEMATLEPAGDEWRSLAPRSTGRLFRLCTNYLNHAVCNWAVATDDSNPFCQSCRLTRIIPDVTLAANHAAWRKLEAAKRRVLYSILRLGLPIVTRERDEINGLTFEFRGDTTDTAEEPVMTGHDSGVITVNIAEADDAERERRRLNLHEPYRTLLGHFRHETGHYYSGVLLGDAARLAAFRDVFGDDRQDYGAALKRHYDLGAPENWQDWYISAYASMHPSEDWAETWAHYLHMTETLETAATSGITINIPGTPRSYSLDVLDPKNFRNIEFDTLLEHWMALAYVLNNLNRSLGLPDGYPFVLSPPAIGKLRFVHESVSQYGNAARRGAV